jgi:hypothetical protein
MNEKIKLLAKQAGGNPNYKAFRGHPLPPPPDYIDPATVDLAKFAELIVRECARVIDRGDGEMSSMDETIWCNVCRDDILEHFGVEE